jgi:hypothetical protein
MTNELIELVFEVVPKEQLNDLVNDLFPVSNVLQIISNDESLEFARDAKFDYVDAIKKTELLTTAIIVKASLVFFDGVSIDNPLCQVLVYEDLVDVLIIFSLSDVRAEDGSDPLKVIHGAASKIAEKSSVSDYYCGLEPAQDERTRFFSKNMTGPLASPWSL